MYKPISTKTHGVLDYLTIAAFITLPRVMGWSRGLTQGMTMLGLGKLGYTLFTRHELAPFKKLPMAAHLALDAAGGAAPCAMPMLLGDEDDCGAVEACCAPGRVRHPRRAAHRDDDASPRTDARIPPGDRDLARAPRERRKGTQHPRRAAHLSAGLT